MNGLQNGVHTQSALNALYAVWNNETDKNILLEKFEEVRDFY